MSTYTKEFYHLASRRDLSLTEEQQTAKYNHGLNYSIQERMANQDVFSVNKAQNKAMKIEKLQSKAPPFRLPLSIEEPVGDDGVSPNSTTVGQPMIQPTAKASTSTPITPAIAKSKKVAMRPIPLPPESTKMKLSSFVSLCHQLDRNLRASSFKEGGTDAGELRCRSRPILTEQFMQTTQKGTPSWPVDSPVDRP